MSESVNMFRKACMCMSRKHALINNCLSCGRIVCQLEGEGPCFFCGNPVYAKNFNPKNQETFEDFEKDFDSHKQYTSAVNYKEKLLNFEQSQIANKKIVDQDVDWYEIKKDVWQDKDVREKAHQKIQELEKEEEDFKNLVSYDVNLKTGQIDHKSFNVDYRKKQEDAQQYLQQEENNRKVSFYQNKESSNQEE